MDPNRMNFGQASDQFNIPDFGEIIPFDMEESCFLEFDKISPDEIAMSTFHNEPIWRCATLIAPAPAPDAFEAHLDEPKEYIIERPTLKRNSSNSNPTIAAPVSPKSFSSSTVRCAPEIPVLLLPTHFEVQLTVDATISRMDEILKSISGLSYEFKSGNCEWTIYYISGPSHCKVEIHLYTGFSTGFIVEGNRLNGDSALFRSLYSQLKAELTSEDNGDVPSYDSFTVFTPLPTPPTILASSNDLHGLGPIFRMAQSPFMEAQMEASRTLCELSAEESMRQQLAELGCVSVLIELLTTSTSEWAQQHAACALANLSDCAECQQAILDSGIAPLLLELSVDGPFQSAELRVLASYILANLASRNASTVAALLGASKVAAWMESVNYVRDERVRLHSMRACESFLVVV